MQAHVSAKFKLQSFKQFHISELRSSREVATDKPTDVNRVKHMHRTKAKASNKEIS